MMPPPVRKYLVSAIAGTPDVVECMLKDVHADDPRWDFRPVPGRFTLREVVAHLADWEPIHLERLQRMVTEDNPSLPNVDEEKTAIDNDYAHSDPHGSMEWLRGGRQKLVQQFQALTDDEWSRRGNRELIGEVTVETHAVFIAAHDGYHTRQIAQWLLQADAALPGK